MVMPITYKILKNTLTNSSNFTDKIEDENFDLAAYIIGEDFNMSTPRPPSRHEMPITPLSKSSPIKRSLTCSKPTVNFNRTIKQRTQSPVMESNNFKYNTRCSRSSGKGKGKSMDMTEEVVEGVKEDDPVVDPTWQPFVKTTTQRPKRNVKNMATLSVTTTTTTTTTTKPKSTDLNTDVSISLFYN